MRNKLLYVSVSIMMLIVQCVQAQTCNKLYRNGTTTSGLFTRGIGSNGGLTYACTLADNVLHSSSGSNPYIATDDISIDQGMAATLHFRAKRGSRYFNNVEIWANTGGYCNFTVYSTFDKNGWFKISEFRPGTDCSAFGPFTLPANVAGGQTIAYCIVLKGATASSFVSIDDICVSQVSGAFVPASMNEDFGTSSTGWYPNTGVRNIAYRSNKNGSGGYISLESGVGSGLDKAAYFSTGFDICSPVSRTGIITREINTSGYANGAISIAFRSKYPCDGPNSYTFDENYQGYSPRIYIMTGPDNGSNAWIQLPVNYYFADYNWRVASYDISAYKNANVHFKIERGGFCSTAREAVDNIRVTDRDCSVSLQSCGTITGETTPLQNTPYRYTVPAVSGASYYRWYVRHEGDLYDAAPYIVSGQGTQNVTVNFQTLPEESGVRVLCIPFDADPAFDAHACYARIGLLNVSVSSTLPLVLDSISSSDPSCFGYCDGTAQVYALGGQPPYTYAWVPDVSSGDTVTHLCAGTYRVTVTDQNGDTVTDSLTLTEPGSIAMPIVTADSLTAFCDGGQVMLSGPPGYDAYRWSTGETTPSITVTTSQAVTLIVTDSTGCESPVSDTTMVTVFPSPGKPEIMVTGDTVLCPGTTTTLSAPAGYVAYRWSDGATTQDVTTDASGIYYVSVTDTTGCESPPSDTVTLTVAADFQVMAGSNRVVYAGYPDAACTTLEATVTGGTGTATLLWSTGETDTEITVCPEETTNYTITATDEDCANSDTVKVCVVDISCGTLSNRVQVCHTSRLGRPRTLCVLPALVPLHLSHGDEPGACGLADLSCADDTSPALARTGHFDKNEEETEAPGFEEELLQTYPNPFAGSVRIGFRLPQDREAVVKVYDMKGTTLRTLFAGKVVADKRYEVVFTPKATAPGDFFMVQLVTSDGEVHTKKIVMKRR